MRYLIILLGLWPSITLAQFFAGSPNSAAARPQSTIAGLPTCNAGSKGLRYMVTDALIPAALATVAAGGAVSIGVTCNGTNWIVQ